MKVCARNYILTPCIAIRDTVSSIVRRVVEMVKKTFNFIANHASSCYTRLKNFRVSKDAPKNPAVIEEKTQQKHNSATFLADIEKKKTTKTEFCNFFGRK